MEHSFVPFSEFLNSSLPTSTGFKGGQQMCQNHPSHNTEHLYSANFVVPWKEYLCLYGPRSKRCFLLPSTGTSLPTHICLWIDWSRGWIYQSTNMDLVAAQVRNPPTLFEEALSADLLRRKQTLSNDCISDTLWIPAPIWKGEVQEFLGVVGHCWINGVLIRVQLLRISSQGSIKVTTKSKRT